MTILTHGAPNLSSPFIRLREEVVLQFSDKCPSLCQVAEGDYEELLRLVRGIFATLTLPSEEASRLFGLLSRIKRESQLR